MTFLISSVYTFLYVAVIIMGGITMTLMLILNIREKDRKHRAVFLFVCSIFIFMILDFITYYFMSEFASGSVVFALIRYVFLHTYNSVGICAYSPYKC